MIRFGGKDLKSASGWVLLTLILLVMLWLVTASNVPTPTDESTGGRGVSSSVNSSMESQRMINVSGSNREVLKEEAEEIVDRFSPKVRTVIKLLQESELQRTSKAQDISNMRRTHFSFRIEPPSDDERARLIDAIRTVQGMRNERGQDLVRWSDYLEKAYGLHDNYPRQVAIMRERGESLLEYLSMIIITPEEAGDALGGSVLIGNEANEPQSWRYSHLMTFDLEEVEDPELDEK